jgi:hypothetical protein
MHFVLRSYYETPNLKLVPYACLPTNLPSITYYRQNPETCGLLPLLVDDATIVLFIIKFMYNFTIFQFYFPYYILLYTHFASITWMIKILFKNYNY